MHWTFMCVTLISAGTDRGPRMGGCVAWGSAKGRVPGPLGLFSQVLPPGGDQGLHWMPSLPPLAQPSPVDTGHSQSISPPPYCAFTGHGDFLGGSRLETCVGQNGPISGVPKASQPRCPLGQVG